MSINFLPGVFQTNELVSKPTGFWNKLKYVDFMEQNSRSQFPTEQSPLSEAARKPPFLRKAIRAAAPASTAVLVLGLWWT
jgi:hypothetical protein